jgi:mannose-1-phosphate guanylyltransferase
VNEHRWGLILSGGEGIRLRPLARLLSGDNRPKQFCRLLGCNTLLAQTMLRIVDVISPEQTLILLTKSHERFYRKEIADLAAHRIVEQPFNRGTLPGMLWSLLRLQRFDDQAVVAIFPSDHYYDDEERFREESTPLSRLRRFNPSP